MSPIDQTPLSAVNGVRADAASPDVHAERSTGDGRPIERAAVAPEGATLAEGGPRFLNREVQWLEFNERVLAQAMDERLPLLERVRFLAIFSSNLDEFFMKRVGGLRRQVASGVQILSYEGDSPKAILDAIRQRVLPMIDKQARCYRKQILPALEGAGIQLIAYRDATEKERRELDRWFQQQVFPILTPLAVDKGHRFPFISNLSVSLGVMLRRPGDAEQLFARVKVPEAVNQWYRLEGTSRFVLLRDVIENNLAELFPGMEILSVLPFRVTRNADVEGDDEDAADLLDQIRNQLRERRFARVVRLQIGRKPPRELLDFLCEELEIGPDDIYESKGLFNYGTLNEIADLDLPEHHFAPWTPVIPPRLAARDRDIFSAIREGDILLHHPYESFDASVERFIEEAASDPSVICIKQALYRTSGDSPFVHELIRAAEKGKQVAVLVELRARFDEERNIEWARRLEDAGVHVAYGVVGLKTHTKIAMVVRREGRTLRTYAHIGTGNYHSRTARLYDDFGLLTCDPVICEDVIDLFNFMTGRSMHQGYRKLLVAPHSMKRQFLRLIEREIEHQRSGVGGRIIAKMNQLQDREVIEALYRASGEGVVIDLIVRGFCTLRPCVRGMSDNIRVISVIGRFLEHSRIFWFRNGKDDPLEGDFYIGSADWMYRNLHTRVEAAAPIEPRALRTKLMETLLVCLTDQRQAWDMHPDGSYVRREPPAGMPLDAPEAVGTHQRLMDLTREAMRAEQNRRNAELAVTGDDGP